MKKEKSSSMPPVAERLYTLMKRSGVNKSGLARICEVTPQAAGKWFTTGNISKESALKIAEAFGVSLTWLLGDELSENSEPIEDDFNPTELSDRQKTLLKLFERLPESAKTNHIAALQEMVENYDSLFKELLKSRNIDEIMKTKKDN
ncbi:MAG: helix-turn-helix domain-containing protein [Enterobacterales bacterium endosymbiont of Blomia tropicalis]|uniref:helix-turn-helix domain-containing protein n=1 Tax=Mixta mediterraneensis TaxID=2758443 RepID=UPI00187574E9|nr:helix-turn-helix domain-containing protein [Mixta mediterraneensis]MBE5253481.1 helix-turn-helix domain-containing protein [Mixta mediterraneensis]MDL4912968.1 helix-turn-helix domain-containing protein [Mixta mediterraneensis]